MPCRESYAKGPFVVGSSGSASVLVDVEVGCLSFLRERAWMRRVSELELEPS